MSFISEEMGKARWDFTNEILEETEHRQLELEPWIAATAKSARLSDLLCWERSTAQWRPRTAFQAAGNLPGKSVDSTRLGGTSGEALARVGCAHDEVATGEPLIKMAKVAGSTDCEEAIRRFEAPGGRVNVLGRCELSPKRAAASLRCRGCLCEITGRSHFPRDENAVSACST